MSKTFRRAAMSTICMLIVAVMSLTGATYAWFTSGEQATVTGMDVTVKSADGGIEVSRTGAVDSWKQVLELGTEFDKTDIKPLSSVDGKKFFNGVISATDSAKLITTAASDTEVSTNVISFDLYLRTTNPKGDTITLDGTYFSDMGKGELAATEIGKAARMAIIVTADTDNVASTSIIAPYGNADGSNIEANTGDYIGIIGASEGFDFKNTLENVASTATVVAPTAVEIKLPGFDASATAGNAVKITVVIWLEGQDSDCVNINANGAFNTYLNFKKVVTNNNQGTEEPNA